VKKKEKIKQTSNLKDKEYLIPLLLALLAFLLYANTIPNDYNLDDEQVTRNHRLTKKGISAIPEIFTSPYHEDDMGYKYEYRPMVLATFAIEKSLFGENPHVSHFFNVLLYALTAALLFITLSSLFSQFNIVLPLSITLLFIAHPLHTEVIASIKNRDEILAFLGGIAALFFSIRFVRSSKLVDYFPVLLFFGLAVISKRSIIPFALIIPLASVFFQRANFKQLLALSLPMAFVVALMAPLFLLRDKVLVGLGLTLAPLVLHLLRDRVDIVCGWKNGVIRILGLVFSKVPALQQTVIVRLIKPVLKVISAFLKKRRDKAKASYQSISRSSKFGEALGKIVNLFPFMIRILIGLFFLAAFVYGVVYDDLIVILISTFLPSLLYCVENNALRRGVLLYQSILISILSLAYWIYIIPLTVIPLLFFLAISHKNWRVVAGVAMIPFIMLFRIGGGNFGWYVAISLIIVYTGVKFMDKRIVNYIIKVIAVIAVLPTILGVISWVWETIEYDDFVQELPIISAFLCIIILSINRIKPFLLQLNLLWVFIIFNLGFVVFSSALRARIFILYDGNIVLSSNRLSAKLLAKLK